MEKTVEKSEQQAEIIKTIAIQIWFLDVEYCEELAKDMLQQAIRQESLAVLNPMHPQKKNEILRAQGVALHHLCDYVKTLKQIDGLKSEWAKESGQRDEINKMFI